MSALPAQSLLITCAYLTVFLTVLTNCHRADQTATGSADMPTPGTIQVVSITPIAAQQEVLAGNVLEEFPKARSTPNMPQDVEDDQSESHLLANRDFSIWDSGRIVGWEQTSGARLRLTEERLENAPIIELAITGGQEVNLISQALDNVKALLEAHHSLTFEVSVRHSGEATVYAEITRAYDEQGQTRWEAARETVVGDSQWHRVAVTENFDSNEIMGLEGVSVGIRVVGRPNEPINLTASDLRLGS